MRLYKAYTPHARPRIYATLFRRRLAGGALTIPLNLRELFIELWPRDPTREDKGDRAWGEQIVSLLDGLRGNKARVVVKLRWQVDCQRFENEDLGMKGWRLRETGEEDVDVVKRGTGMCRRPYELKRQ